jgi:(+)-trans-carveol dehydrogenase
MTGSADHFPGRFEGKTVFISGGARGQGRSHARRFALEGANIVTFDVCEPVPKSQAPTATPEDLAETVEIIEGLDRRIVAEQADVRDFAAVERVIAAGLEAFGQIDVVVANAGIGGDAGVFWEISEESFDNVVDVDLKGVWNTVRAAVPSMIESGPGGAIVITSSAAGLKGYPHIADYVAAKHGVVGLMRVMAQELAEHGIRANSVHPTNVNTPIFVNDTVKKLFIPDLEDPESLSVEDFEAAVRPMNLLPVGWVEPEDITAAVTWLASPEARYVTGVTLPVDAGHLVRA